MKRIIKYLHVGRFERAKRIHFLINLSVGILIALVFVVMSNSNWGEKVVNQGFDILVRLEHRIYSEKNAARNCPVYFIDITHDDYKKWGRFDITPRGRIASMVEDAWKKGAAVVFVDVLMSKPNLNDAKGDLALRNLLERMLRENAGTHVILPVTVSSDGTLNSHYLDNLLDRTTADGRQIFHRGYPAIAATSTDLQNRYWEPYQPYLDNNGIPHVLWSVTMLATAIREGEGKLAELKALGHKLEMNAALGAKGTKKPYVITMGVKPSGTTDSTFKNMLSGIPNQILGINKQGAVMISTFHVASGNDHSTVLIRDEPYSNIYTQRVRFRLAPDSPSTARLRITAEDFVSGEENPLPDLKGKIVLLGNTSPDLGDYHWTPVGRIAGVYILGNAINTLAVGLQPLSLSGFMHIVIELFVIVVAAYFFHFFSKFLAQISASVLFVIIFFPLSWWLYDTWGLFFNFIVPLMAMSFHNSASCLEQSAINKFAK